MHGGAPHDQQTVCLPVLKFLTALSYVLSSSIERFVCKFSLYSGAIFYGKMALARRRWARAGLEAAGLFDHSTAPKSSMRFIA